ncbi:hypothetical protein N9D08_00030 [bacterium]|nr:hypothetical protein [bacterium]
MPDARRTASVRGMTTTARRLPRERAKRRGDNARDVSSFILSSHSTLVSRFLCLPSRRP